MSYLKICSFIINLYHMRTGDLKSSHTIGLVAPAGTEILTQSRSFSSENTWYQITGITGLVTGFSQSNAISTEKCNTQPVGLHACAIVIMQCMAHKSYVLQIKFVLKHCDMAQILEYKTPSTDLHTSKFLTLTSLQCGFTLQNLHVLNSKSVKKQP